ncbi:MAG: PEP-CTERM sorting domain-containing protein [Verrucomicrobiota bacterium]|nr:PEP-CTERM sorting domain-containing protein [Verrucomicrobiota bacterium]
MKMTEENCSVLSIVKVEKTDLRFAWSGFAIFTLLLTLLASTRASASIVITDYKFDALNIGDSLPTTVPSTDPFPQQNVYAVGGFPNDNDPSSTNPLTGTVTVQNVGSLSKAALMSTTQAGTGALYIDTQFQASASLFNLSFDINVVAVPSSGLPQPGVGSPNGQAFAINAFGLDSARLFRFAVSPTSATAGNFGYRLPGPNGDLATFGTYTEGETYHVEYLADFATSKLNIFLDGVQKVTNADLLNAGAGVSELFMFQNGVNGQLNQVALDNIHSTATAAVPEPSTFFSSAFALLGFGAVGLLRKISSRPISSS